MTPAGGANGHSPTQGYYRFPIIHEDFIIFTAEGDLWRAGVEGGQAVRLTSHHGLESYAAVSPDGKTIAFSGEYEGPTEVYTMPAAGGLPTRRTYEGEQALVRGWTPEGKIIYSTRYYSTLPNTQLAILDTETDDAVLLPLNQASDGVFDPTGKTFFFTRLPFQGSHTKRYKGGSVEQIWRFSDGDDEALPLTQDYPGTSRNPMWFEHRIFFASDRGGSMNLWSMDESGKDLKQHTFHEGWDVKSPSMHKGRVVYQLGADLYLLDLKSGESRCVEITLVSDFDQRREKWVNDPLRYLTSAHISPDGDRVVLTARGRIFVTPSSSGHGRTVDVVPQRGVRYRNARFLPDGKSVLAQSDESGEIEFWRFPANGVGKAEQLTKDADVFRHAGVISPDGKHFAFTDKNLRLWLHEIEKNESRVIATSDQRYGFYGLAWSPNSQWLAFVKTEENLNARIGVFDLENDKIFFVTSDRVDSYSPCWGPGGRWLCFLSDRHFSSVVSSPWGPRQPEPYFEKTSKIYALSLYEGDRFPFLPDDELHLAKKEEVKENNGDKNENGKAENKEDKQEEKPSEPVNWDDVGGRLYEIPVVAGDYSSLALSNKHLLWIEHDVSDRGKKKLMSLEVKNKDIEPKTLAEDVRSFELSHDLKKMLVRKGRLIYVCDSGAESSDKVFKNRVDLYNWSFTIDPREEWRQMFVEAWRMQRDYFYAPNMHGVDWQKLLDQHSPLLDRVTDRDELNDLLGQMLGEVSALHTFVRAGDLRSGDDYVTPASLGALLKRDKKAGGFRIDKIYRGDMDYLTRISPLQRPETGVREGDIIESVNGVKLSEVKHLPPLLKNQERNQALLRVKPEKGGDAREIVVQPMSGWRLYDLRYDDWEQSRLQYVEEKSKGALGYVHLRAMRGENYSEWVRRYYPVFNRHGLIIDVRHNRGGNIDSWILEKLLRKPWFYWQPRVGKPYWSMQYAFHGHMVVLIDEKTASDGEAFADGFRRLGLGKIIGKRSWGGEIWLAARGWLADNGMATAAEIGVYGPEGEWLVEGHGVDPDIEVDNAPHATFKGQDAQLDAAISHLQKLIKKKPVEIPPAPPHPDKSFNPPKKQS